MPQFAPTATPQPAVTTPAPAKADAKVDVKKDVKPERKDGSKSGNGSRPTPLPPGVISIGAWLGDQMFEAFGDVLLPVWGNKSTLVFLNPRGSAMIPTNKSTTWAWVRRYLFPKREIILGANGYFDSRRTS